MGCKFLKPPHSTDEVLAQSLRVVMKGFRDLVGAGYFLADEFQKVVEIPDCADALVDILALQAMKDGGIQIVLISHETLVNETFEGEFENFPLVTSGHDRHVFGRLNIGQPLGLYGGENMLRPALIHENHVGRLNRERIFTEALENGFNCCECLDRLAMFNGSQVGLTYSVRGIHERAEEIRGPIGALNQFFREGETECVRRI